MWENYNKNQDKVYDSILQRAKLQLPEISISDSRFVIPQIDSRVEGNRTFFRNFKEVINTLNRPDPHFLKFLTNELGTSGNIEGTRAIFQGKHPKLQISKLLDRYVKDYVICSVCGKPDTKFISQGRVNMLKCDACGAQTNLRSLN